MNAFKYVFLFFVCFTQTSAFARSAWTGNVQIQSVYMVNERQVGFKLTTFSNPAGCNLPKNIDVGVDPVIQPEAAYYLDLAFSKNRTVNLWIRDQCISTHWQGITLASVGHVRVFWPMVRPR